MNRIKTAVALLVLSVFCLGLSGCSLERHLTVGMVDTDRIIKENPQYMELNILLMSEREAVYSQIPSNVRSLPDSEKASLRKKIQKDASERSQKFDKVYREFMKKLQQDIQAHAQAVAERKGIDMVIINTSSYPTVLYSSGDNITTDILLRMKQ